MSQMIEIPAAQILGAVDTQMLAEVLLERVKGEVVPHFGSGAAAPSIGQPWPGQGGIYAGTVRGQDGQPDYHLIVYPHDLDDSDWNNALAWAKEITEDGHSDFTLPHRHEQAILFGNVPELLQKAYYWSGTQHASYLDCAWYQSFDNGGQDYSLKDHQLRARAVRRSTI